LIYFVVSIISAQWFPGEGPGAALPLRPMTGYCTLNWIWLEGSEQL